MIFVENCGWTRQSRTSYLRRKGQTLTMAVGINQTWVKTLLLLGSVAKGTWVLWTHISISLIPIPSHLTIAKEQAERKRPSGTKLKILLSTISVNLECKTLLGQWKRGHSCYTGNSSFTLFYSAPPKLTSTHQFLHLLLATAAFDGTQHNQHSLNTPMSRSPAAV